MDGVSKMMAWAMVTYRTESHPLYIPGANYDGLVAARQLHRGKEPSGRIGRCPSPAPRSRSDSGSTSSRW